MGKTTQVAANQAKKNDDSIILPTEIARGIIVQNIPSLQALKLMHLIIDKAGGRMADDVCHQFRLSDIKRIDGMNNHTRASLTPLFAELEAVVMINDDTTAKSVTIGGILDHAHMDFRDDVSGDVLISWYFRRMFRDMARESNHWAILDRQTVFHLGSRYSILLFQHIASLVKLQNVSIKRFTVQELRAMFGIPEGKFKRFSHLNNRVLQPAIAEINQLSRITLTATLHKAGRTVADVEILWKFKPDLSETKRELDQPKTGRKARRDGSAETLVITFPVAGSISHGRWGEAVRKHAPKPTPDVDLVASAFRKWCQVKSIPLDAASIEKAFATFCKNYGRN